MQQVQNRGGGRFPSPGGRFSSGRGHGGGRGYYFQEQSYNSNAGKPQQQHTLNNSYTNYLSEISYIGSSPTTTNTLPPPPQPGYIISNYYQQQQFP